MRELKLYTGVLSCAFTMVVIVGCKHLGYNSDITLQPDVYLRIDTSIESKIYNSGLLFRKNGTVSYISDYVEPQSTFDYRLRKYAVPVKYSKIGDSITFHMDSIFIGFRTVTYTYKGVQKVDSFPQYSKGISIDFKGKLKNDTLVFRVVEVDTLIRRDIFIRTEKYARRN